MIFISNQHKSKNRNEKTQKAIIVVLAGIAIIAIAVAVWALSTKNTKDNTDMNEQNPSQHNTTESSSADEAIETVEVLTDTIDLPQFAWLNLKADTKEQELTFTNPPQNFANIRVSILLPDRTVLWTSEIIPPGKTSENVVLSQALSSGDYKNSILKYECFQNDEGLTPLNGAENTLILRVN